MAIGVDIVNVERISKMKHKDRFIHHVFTPNEEAYIQKRKNKDQTIAGLFAAKEAISKVFGTGIGNLSFQDIEISHTANGAPFCRLNDKIKEMMKRRAFTSLDISITHEKELAVAMAMGVEGERVRMNDYHLDKELVFSLLKRDKKGYKYNYGKIAIVGGSAGMAGSVCLAAQAALRTGSGMVYVLVPRSIAEVVQLKLTEAIVVGIEDEGKGYFLSTYAKETVDALQGFDCIAIGPGLGRSSGIPVWLRHVLENVDAPLVLDADGLYAVAQDRALLKECAISSVVTPHEQEMSRLTGYTLQEIRENRANVALEFAKKHQVHVVLKGAETVITNGDVYYLNNTGNPGMATPGSGDVLTGVIASLLGYGYAKFTAIRLGTYIHGLAGDYARDDKGEDGLIASDIIYNLPYVLKDLKEIADEHREEAEAYKEEM